MCYPNNLRTFNLKFSNSFYNFFGSIILFYTNHKIKKWGDIRQEFSSKILNTLQKVYLVLKK